MPSISTIGVLPMASRMLPESPRLVIVCLPVTGSCPAILPVPGRVQAPFRELYVLELHRGDVRAREPAVHEEGRRVYVRGVVGGQEEDGARDLRRLREPAHREVDQPSCGFLRVLGEKLLQERSVDRTGTQGVDAYPPACELDPELAAQGQHAALRGGVGDLGGRRPHHGDERGGIDNGATAPLQKVRYPILAAQENAPPVHVLDALPGFELRLQNRVVVGWGDAGVVEEHVYAPEALRRLAVHPLDVAFVGYVGVDVEAFYLGGRLLARLVRQVRYADPGVFFGEAAGRLAANAAGSAGYHGDLSTQASRHF